LRALKELEDMFGEMEFSTVYQRQAHGNADAIYKAKEFAGDDPVAVKFFAMILLMQKFQP